MSIRSTRCCPSGKQSPVGPVLPRGFRWTRRRAAGPLFPYGRPQTERFVGPAHKRAVCEHACKPSLARRSAQRQELNAQATVLFLVRRSEESA